MCLWSNCWLPWRLLFVRSVLLILFPRLNDYYENSEIWRVCMVSDDCEGNSLSWQRVHTQSVIDQYYVWLLLLLVAMATHCHCKDFFDMTIFYLKMLMSLVFYFYSDQINVNNYQIIHFTFSMIFWLIKLFILHFLWFSDWSNYSFYILCDY